MHHDSQRFSVTLIGRRLVVSIGGDLSDLDPVRLESSLLKRVESTEVDVVAFDISTVEVADLHEFKMFTDLLKVVALMGVTPVVLGMRPGIAAFLAESDMDLRTLRTALSFDDIDYRLSAAP